MRHRGSVLILALWSISVLAILAVSLGAGTRQKLTLLHRLHSASVLHASAAAGVDLAKSVLRPQDLTETFDTLLDEWARNESFRGVPLPDASFTVGYAGPGGATVCGLVDEDRKLNLNVSDGESNLRLLKILGAAEDEDEAMLIANAIVDWRDADSGYQHPEYGAEDDDYDDLVKPYVAKDAPYEALEELLLVKGIKRPIFDKIRPFVTIYGKGGVNLNTVGREVLVAMGVTETLADKILAYRAGADKKPLTSDDLYFTSPEAAPAEIERIVPIDAAEQVALDNLVGTGAFRTASTFFEVISRAKLDSTGAELETRAVLDRRGKVYSYRVSKVQWPSRS